MQVYQNERCAAENMSDREILCAVLEGNQSAFEVIVRRYSTPLFKFIYRMIGDRDLASDVGQQVFLRLYTSLKAMSFQSEKPLKPWLFQVAHNCCIDEIRRRKRQAISFSYLMGDEDDVLLPAIVDIPDPEPLAEDVVEHQDLQNAIQNAIESLPARFRAIVAMRYASQLPFSEIAQVLGIPEGTAKTYFQRSKNLLRKALEKESIRGYLG